MKKANKTMVITTILCLLPILLGVLLYPKLPDQVPAQWGSDGQVNWYQSKAMAVFGMPAFLAIINLVVHIGVNNDPKRANASKMLKNIGFWICPIISLIFVPISLFASMGMEVHIAFWTPLFVGVLLIIIGNYLPKCKQSYTVGIRLPWTLDNETNWNKTHHFAGYLWIIGGIITIISSFFSFWPAIFLVILLIVLIPIVYSFVLYKRGNQIGKIK